MVSDIDMVTRKSEHLARLLKEKFHAEGDELEQLIVSCEERLPHDVLSKLHYIAVIHDEISHQSEFVLADIQAFNQAYEQCVNELTPRSSKFVWRVVGGLMFIITLAALIVYYIHWEKVQENLFN